jgi:mono/diheme cytochrome c family protein
MSGRALTLLAGAALAALAGVYLWHRQSAPPTPAEQRALIDKYCVVCHNEIELAGGVAFDHVDPDNLHVDAKLWETAIRKLRGHLMPPPGESRPSDARINSLVSWLEASLDAAAHETPNPGAPVLHRLNRAEYANAIRDLVALPIDATTLLPGDDSSGGFDNISNALSVSPALMQAYVAAATSISRLAVGDPAASSSITTYRAPRGLVQADHLEGQPLGTRGGMLVTHVFPLDAEYEFRIGRGFGGFGLETVGGDEDVEITINGERVALLSSAGGRRGPSSVVLKVPAGPQTIGVALIRKRNAEGVDDLYAVHAASPGIANFAILGPANPTGRGDTPSRRKIFVCRPTDTSEEPACAQRIVARLARYAFRRPVADDDPTLGVLMRFYRQGRELGDFDTGIQHALARVLVDPEFVFRFEKEPKELPAGTVYALDDPALASRLSFFLWSSLPDEELLSAAEQGRLHEPEELERQVRRMLADEKAEALVTNFASQWLLLRQLDTVNPATNDFDGNLRQAFRREAELLFGEMLDNDESVVSLLDADHTYVDERLARHYGIPHVRGSRFRRVALEGDARRGLLGLGSILTVTSAPNRTSPVKRGQWVLENVLGSPVPPPPEGVDTNIDKTAAATAEAHTMRQRLERHMADPGCAACHNLMDPIGFALENFDMIGRWRDADGGEPVDASGEFIDGTKLSGPADLRRALLARRGMFVEALTEKLMTYALGRTVEYFDLPAVREIVRAAAADDYRFSSLAIGIARSVPFRMKRKLAPAESAVALNARGAR